MAENTGDIRIRDPVLHYAARVFSVTSTSLPDYGLSIQPQRASNPGGAYPSVPVALNFDASRVFSNLTTTALAAGSSYTSGYLDYNNYMGAGLFVRSDQPVQIEIQESYDGSTFARTWVFYLGEGPARTFHGIILFTLAQRYWRVIATNIGYATQSTFRLDRITYAIPGQLDISHLKATVERTTTALAASATYTSRTYVAQCLKRIGCYLYADQAGTLNYDVSFDGSTWRTVKSVSVSAGQTLQDYLEPIGGHYVRLRYVNGATAQAAFDFTIFVDHNN
jgi:hypothetical protein